MERLELRRLGPDDLDAMMQLARSDARNLHVSELSRFLALEGAYVMGVTRDGRLVGLITAFRLFDRGWLGPVVVEGGDDAVGISMVLAQEAVGGLQRLGVDTIGAEATPTEAAMLEHLGFSKERRTLIFERAPGAAEPAEPATRALSPTRDLLDIGALDADAVGHGRKEWLLHLAEEFPEGARVVGTGDEVRGFVLMRRTRRGYAVGPLVTAGNDATDAEPLLASAVAAASSWPIVALAPEGTPLAAALARHGFLEVGSLLRMRAGTLPEAPAATEWLMGGRMTG